jgi:hypothetical protein
MVTGLIESWALVLSDLSDQQLQAGLVKCCTAGGDHPPSAGDYRKSCLGNDTASIEAKAAAAWKIADEAARGGGSDFNPKHLDDHLLMHALGAVGGWAMLCSSPITEWQERNFIKAYVAASRNPQLEEVAKLSYQGKPLGALKDLRSMTAKQLTRQPPSVAVDEAQREANAKALDELKRKLRVVADPATAAKNRETLAAMAGNREAV